MRWYVVCWSLIALAAVPRGAAQVSTLGMDAGAGFQYGGQFFWGDGVRPALAGGGRFCQWGALYTVRSGVGFDPTGLGTQIGPEFEMRLGFADNERPGPGGRSPVAFDLALGLGMRAWSFNVPLPGMLALFATAELGAGGAHWWAEKARLAFVGGGRLGLRLGVRLRAELEYRLNPYTVLRAPGDLRVSPLEQRGLVTVGYGDLGFGLGASFTHLRAQRDALVEHGRARTLTLMMQYRPLEF